MTQGPEYPDPQQPASPYDPYGQPAQPGQQQSWPAAPGGPGGQVPYHYGYGYPPAPQQRPASGMYVAAAVLNWVTLGAFVIATCGLGLLAAAWYVPMTIAIHKASRDRYKHTTLGVCTLLFCNLISGILMLVEDGNREAPPV